MSLGNVVLKIIFKKKKIIVIAFSPWYLNIIVEKQR